MRTVKSFVAWRAFLLCSLAWYLLICILYARQIDRLPHAYLWNSFQNTKDFLLWQALGFLALLIPFSALELRPRPDGKGTTWGSRWFSPSADGAVNLTGRFTVTFLGLSTLLLLHKLPTSLG